MEKVSGWLTPAARMPWPVSTPFRMRPNLEKLDAQNPALLLRDDLAPTYTRERERVMRETPERAMVGIANDDVLSAIDDLVGAVYRDQSSPSNELSPCETWSRQAAPTAQTLALQIQEDFVILKNENGTLRTEYLSVCFPSRWDPREKLGLNFMQIHAPVADNQMLLAAGSSITKMAFMKQPMVRHVWLVVPSASLPQHPDQNDYSWSETLKDDSPLLPRLFFRVERQTTWPLPHLGRAVFFIRVMMCPLIEVLQINDSARPKPVDGRARQLHDALASMTHAVVEYRGMTAAMPRLLAELAIFSE